MGTKLPYRDWLPQFPGEVIVGHLLYFENPEDGTFTSIIRSHGVFFRLPQEVATIVKTDRPNDGALVVIEYQEDGYHMSVLCEYRQATRKLRRIENNHGKEQTNTALTKDAK